MISAFIDWFNKHATFLFFYGWFLFITGGISTLIGKDMGLVFIQDFGGCTFTIGLMLLVLSVFVHKVEIPKGDGK